MIQIGGRHLNRWMLPFASAAILVTVLFFCIPYASGYEHSKMALGVLLWDVCMAGQNSRVTLDFSYCLFVPVIVGYLIYLKKDELARQPIRGSNAALGLLAVGLLLYWLGLRAETQFAGYAGMQLLFAGIILWLWGTAVFRVLLFPWAFLIFFWPLPFLDSTVAFPLRMVMTHLAYDILQVLGVPTVQNGTALVSAPDPLVGLAMGQRFRIDIADPCSGIRSLLALLMISALYAYLSLPKLWQQWVIFLSAVPLTIVGNLARVLILIAGSIYFGSAFAIGTYDNPSWFHEGAGYAVYGVALGLELALGTLLSLKWRGRIKTAGKTAPKRGKPKAT